MTTDADILAAWQAELDAELTHATLAPSQCWPPSTPFRPVKAVLADRRALDELRGHRPRLTGWNTNASEHE